MSRVNLTATVRPEIKDKIDRLAELLNLSSSRLVENALMEFVDKPANHRLLAPDAAFPEES